MNNVKKNYELIRFFLLKFAFNLLLLHFIVNLTLFVEIANCLPSH